MLPLCIEAACFAGEWTTAHSEIAPLLFLLPLINYQTSSLFPVPILPTNAQVLPAVHAQSTRTAGTKIALCFRVCLSVHPHYGMQL